VIVAHLDLDAFFAAVEELEDPSLRARPLVVGGDPHGRGVVATANYAARRFGIQSAMSCAEALRRCPHVVFLRPRHTLYREYSRAVRRAAAAGCGTEGRGALARGRGGDDRRAGVLARRRVAPSAPRYRRPPAARPRPWDRPARPRALRRAHLDQRREHVRARPRR